MNKISVFSLTALLGLATLAGCTSTKDQDMMMDKDQSMSSQRQQSKTYTLQAGDTLKSVAKKFYGDESQWVRIYRANSNKLSSTDAIKVGLKLTIPPAGSGSMDNMNSGGSMNSGSDSGSSSSDQMKNDSK